MEATSEQRQRFESEFAEYWNSLIHDPRDNRTDSEQVWVAARVYSERLIGITPMELK
jgi:hypothetical protein